MLLCVLLGVCCVTPLHRPGYSKILAHIQFSAKQQLSIWFLCLVSGWMWALKQNWYLFAGRSHKGLGNSEMSEVSLVSFRDVIFLFKHILNPSRVK